MNLNQKFKKVFVTTNNTLLASGTTTGLADGQLGIFDADTYTATNAPLWANNKGIIIAQGTPDLSGYPQGAYVRNETDKSKVIVGRKILGWRKKEYTAGQNGIVTIGWDGNPANRDTKNMTVKCDEIKHLYIRLTGKPIEDLFPGGYTLHVQAQGACCDECGDNCDTLDPTSLRDEFYDRIVEHTFLGGMPITKYISVTKLDTTHSVTGAAVVGLEFESAFVDRDTDTCYFNLFPYNADPVHIQLSEWNPDWHGEPERCRSTYPVTVTQEVEYPFGDGQSVIRLEAREKGMDARDYSMDHARRKARGESLNTNPAVNYDLYALSYEIDYHVGAWSDVYTDRYELLVFVQTGQTAFKDAINAYVTSVTGLGIEPVA